MKARILALLAVCTIVLAGPEARATWPGENGLIVVAAQPLGSPDDPDGCVYDDPYQLHTMEPDGSNLEQIADVGTPYEPTWAPKRSRIAFGLDEGSDGAGIYTIRSDGTNFRQIIDEEAQENHPTWSPSGWRIAYQRDWRRRGGSNIWSVRTNGIGRVQLTSHRGEDTMPAWSPDGRRGRRPVYGAIDSISWSPDGQWILYSFNAGSGGTFIYKMRRDGSDKTKLAEGMDPVWSPNGRWIMFDENPQSRTSAPKVKKMRPNGSGVRTVHTPSDIDLWRPDWQAR